MPPRQVLSRYVKPLERQTRILDHDLRRERFLIAVEGEPREDPGLIIVSDWTPDSIGSQPAHR